MQLLLIIAITLVIASLTFFTGFGLGTLLLPAYVLLFPLTTAIAGTAIVHLSNNLFKLVLVFKHVVWRLFLPFGVPAMLASAVGALVLGDVSHWDPLYSYELAGKSYQILAVKLLVAILMLSLALLEVSNVSRKISLPPRALPLGGALTGFFGGLSGHQGAFRSAFLIKVGLSKEEFIATGCLIAVLVDLARLGVYLKQVVAIDNITKDGPLIGLSALAAMIGSFIASKYLHKVSLRVIEILVSLFLLVTAVLLGTGLI